MKTHFAYLVLLSLALSSLSVAQTTQPAPGEFELREWAVFVLDASQNKLNPDGFVSSTLPEFVESHRQAAGADAQQQPSPLCVIHLIGQSDTKVDVDIERSAGSFMSSWPPAQTRIKQLLWRNLTLGDQPGKTAAARVPDHHWFESLRATPSAYLSQQDGPTERFLLYDVEIPYTSPLQVRSDKDFSVEYKNTGKNTLHDLTFYFPDHNAWRQASIGDLAPPATRPAATQPAATRPATQKSPPIQKVQLMAAPSTRPADLAGNWRKKLSDRGVADSDCDVILNILTANAFDPHRLTAVYFLDSSELDKLLTLEVLPEPAKISRVAIVIVKNADLAAGSEIDDLIIQLGNPVWAKRVAAFDALQKIGPAALPKLQDALQNKDTEIVWRAERLIAKAQKPQGAQP